MFSHLRENSLAICRSISHYCLSDGLTLPLLLSIRGIIDSMAGLRDLSMVVRHRGCEREGGVGYPHIPRSRFQNDQ